jgi:hypothetical protein
VTGGKLDTALYGLGEDDRDETGVDSKEGKVDGLAALNRECEGAYGDDSV